MALVFRIEYVCPTELIQLSTQVRAYSVVDRIKTGDSADCAFKFVLIRNTMFLGPIQSHAMLYLLATIPKDEKFPLALKAASRLTAMDELHRDKATAILAAGMFQRNGTVTQWNSQGFGVWTPEEHRPEIEERLREWLRSPVGRTALLKDGID